MDSEYIIEMLGITKEFPEVIANDNVTLRLRKGEIHAILGENGAGKSTLMSILFGIYEPDKGEIRMNGKKVAIRNPNDATNLGIGMVHQHFRLIDVFTVTDNIILGAETTSLGFIKRKEAKEKVLALSEKYNLRIDPEEKIMNISVGMQQRLEILKMLYRENEILIFDEPTAMLTKEEAKKLIETMKAIKKEGKTILFISHKLDEIMEVSDRVTVMRKGRHIDTVKTSETDKETLAEMMIGKPFESTNQKRERKYGNVVLKVEKLTVSSPIYKNKTAVNNVSFKVKEGEILAIAGIEGNGQSELIYALTGLYKTKSGNIVLSDSDITNKSVRYRNELGISHIPEDRHKYGLVLDFPLKNNCILNSYFTAKFQKNNFMKKERIDTYTEKLIEKFDINSSEGPSTFVRTMSGGNQQKTIIAREIARNKSLLIAVQPTRGLDIAATQEIHKILLNERNKGKAIILVSLDLDEILKLSDRILVMHQGRITGEFVPKETTPTKLGLYMTGSKEKKNAE